jgi:hypothetical protein
VALGDTALDSNVSGASNVAIGADALTANTASNNTAVGYQAGVANTTGIITSSGYRAGYSNTTGANNSFFGVEAGYANTTSSNSAYFGEYSGRNSTGAQNTFYGQQSGWNVTTGSKNTILGRYNGNQDGLDIRTSSNNIVLSDGDGYPRTVINSNGQQLHRGSETGTLGDWIVTWRMYGTNTDGLNISYSGVTPNNTSRYFLRGGDAGAHRFFVYSNGNIVNINNSYGAVSDVKLKENIVDASSQWDDIKALTVRKYSMKSDELDAPNMLGVIAQEVEAAGMSGLINDTPDFDRETREDLGTVTKTVNYSILYMKAVKALQEAMTRIETLEAKVTALEGN